MRKAPSPPSLDELLSHMGWVRNLARGLVREEDAEDLAQETMLRAIQKPPKHDDNLRGWLAMISRNLTRSTRRKEARRSLRFEENQPRPMDPPKPEELFARAEMAENVRDLVDQLEDSARYLILLRFHEGRKTDEIAQMLGISRRAAQSRLDRAMAKLRESMRHHFGKDYIVACLILAAPIGSPIASTVPAGTAATASAFPGPGLAFLLKGLLAMAALLLPVFFIVFDPPPPSDLEGSGNLATALSLEGPVQEPVPSAGRTQAASTPHQSNDALVQLIVVDEGGMPVPDARMVVRSRGGNQPNQLWSSPLDQTNTLVSVFQSDQDGLFSAQLPPDQKVVLFVGSRFLGMKKLPITTPKAGITLELQPVTLKPANCLVGDILDRRGLPVSDAVIFLQRANKANSFLTRSFEHRTVSGKEGGYELPSVSPGDYVLQVAHPQFERLISTPFRVEASRNVEQQKNVQLSRGLVVAGIFEDSAGAPVSGASIWALDPSELSGASSPTRPQGIRPSGISAEDGSFLVQGWSEARGSSLFVEAIGFLTIVLPASEITDHMQVTLQRGLSLSIKVEKNRKPQADARVSLTQRNDSRNSHAWTQVSQANGRAHFHGLAPGFYQAAVTDERGYGITVPFELRNGGHEELLTLKQGARFEFLAVDETGDPIPNVPIYLLRTGASSQDIGADSAPSAANSMSASGKTNGRGRFQISLFPGKWMITASPRGRSRLDMQKDFLANQVTNLTHEFGLVGSLNVTASAFSGPPLAGLRLGLMPHSGGSLRSNRTDTNGQAIFRNLRAGEYSLFPWSEKSTPAAPPSDAVKVTIQPGKQISHSLNPQFVSVPTFRVMRNGLPVADAQLHLLPVRSPKTKEFDSRNPSKLRTDENGEWNASPIRIGDYRVTVRGSENVPEQRWTLNLKSGASLHELRLDDFQIVGIFKDSGGNPLSGVGVELERQVRGTDGSVLEAPNSLKKSGPVHVTSNSKGQFEFSGVPSGKWQIRVRGQAWTSPLSNLFKVDDANLNLGVITLSGSCSINLQLSAQALHDVELRGGQRPDLELLHLQSQLRFLLHPDDRGRVNRSDLPAGEYELLVADRPSTLVRLSTAQPTELVLN